MSDVIERLLEQRTEAIKHNRDLECFKVSAGDYKEIMCSPCVLIDIDPMPTPPIEAQASWGGGLFGSSGRYEKRDHHAPEYLEAMSAWRCRMRDTNRDRRPYIFGIPIEITP